MERKNIEEGLLLRRSMPDADDQNHNINGGFGESTGLLPRSREPSVTAAVILSTVVAVCGSFCYGSATGYSAPVESAIMEDLGLSTAAYSVFGSIFTIGGMFGAMLSGKIADLIGRLRTMWISDIFFAVGWLAIAFAKDAWWLDIGRLLLGIGGGIITYVVPVYIAEITPKNLRGRFSSANQLMSASGFAMAYFVGTMISWRSLALISVVSGIAQIIGLFFIPESPRWLAKVGRDKEFETALQHLRGEDTDISGEAADIRDYIETSQQETEARFLDLFQRRYANSLFVGVGLMALQQLEGISGLAYYSSSIFEEAGFSSSIGLKVAAAEQIPAAGLGLFLMDKSGRRPLLLVSATGMFWSYIILGLSFSLKGLPHLKKVTPILSLIGILGCGIAYNIGMAGIPWIIMSEIFPVNVKASAGSLVTFVHWFCSWIITFSFNFLMEWSSAGTIFIFAGVVAVTVLFVAKFVPETKGKTLEEMQALMTRFL
ncbi:hypothetical protein SLE2022_083000 [Rubroshorea leprosula]